MLVLRGVVWCGVCHLSLWDVSGARLRLCQRSDPLVIIEYLCCGVFFFLQEHQLRVLKESTLFGEIARGPLLSQHERDEITARLWEKFDRGPHARRPGRPSTNRDHTMLDRDDWRTDVERDGVLSNTRQRNGVFWDRAHTLPSLPSLPLSRKIERGEDTRPAFVVWERASRRRMTNRTVIPGVVIQRD